MSHYVALDTETTGVEAGSRACEIGAQLTDETGKVLDERTWLIDPGMPMPPDTAIFHGKAFTGWEGHRPAREVYEEFLAWLPRDATVLAYNAPYDVGVISYELGRLGIPLPQNLVVDALAIAKAKKATPNNKLDTVVDFYAIKRHGTSHRALSDADATRQYFFMFPTPVSTDPWALEHAYPVWLPETLRDLPQLVETAASFGFRYRDKSGNVTTRTLTPFGFAECTNGLMFHGWCPSANARRSFYAASILERL